MVFSCCAGMAATLVLVGARACWLALLRVRGR